MAAAAVAAAVLLTWPLAAKASHHLLSAIYHWDAYTNTMILGSRVDALLGRSPLSLYDNYFHAPLPHSIALNENHFGLSLLFAPFYLTTGNPLWAYNVTLLTSLALSVFFTVLLVRRLTGDGFAGLLAGVAFAFCPYVMFELGRIQLVATQWIPACFLMLHRAVETRRWRDVMGFWLFYLLQLGTCLYYAMFLAPLLALVLAVLLFRERPPARFTVKLAMTGVAAGAVAFAMVYPYFAARGAFQLERGLEFASSYDGKLEFFTNVPETNLTLTALHHRSGQPGAHEQIAFPGFTVLSMMLVGLTVALRAALRRQGARQFVVILGRWLAVGALTFIAILLTHSLLAGAVVFGLCIWQAIRGKTPVPFAGRQGLYLAVLLLAVVLFLGLTPMRWGNQPVRGLYYYLYSYVPGFDGIRKVSRQAVMTTFSFCLLASFGSAWLFSKLSPGRSRVLVFSALLTTTIYELRCFPHPLQRTWADKTVPAAYRFMASLPPKDLLTFIPQNEGVRRFRGDEGMAFYNYLALFHKHRFLNGQGSYMPQVTELVRRAQQQLPDEGARRVLWSLGARHFLVHSEELPPARRALPELLTAQTQHYRRVFQEGTHSVFSLLDPEDPTLALLETPKLPAGARLIPRRELRALAAVNPEWTGSAIDGRLRTFWATRRPQVTGQYFELALSEPRPIVAFEIDNAAQVMQVPLSYQLSVSRGGSDWRVVARQPKVRLFREQVYSPRTFVFRVVLGAPTVADRIRITIEQSLPGYDFTIREARLYAKGS